jgi:hypothetical protein
MSIALAIAAALAVLCLAYVLYPLIGPRRASAPQRKAQPRTPVTDEEIEATVRAYRAAHVVGTHCAVCGSRPETDAVFCSNCGRRLVDAPG